MKHAEPLSEVAKRNILAVCDYQAIPVGEIIEAWDDRLFFFPSEGTETQPYKGEDSVYRWMMKLCPEEFYREDGTLVRHHRRNIPHSFRDRDVILADKYATPRCGWREKRARLALQVIRHWHVYVGLWYEADIDGFGLHSWGKIGHAFTVIGHTLTGRGTDHRAIACDLRKERGLEV